MGGVWEIVNYVCKVGSFVVGDCRFSSVCMKIWCFSFLCLGEEEEERNSDISNLDIRYYFNFDNKGIEAMREGILGTGSKDAENDESELVFWEPFGDGSSGGGDDRPGLGFQVDDERVNATDNNENFNFNIEFEKKSEDLLRWIDDLGSSSTGGGRESQGLNVDVNLNLGLGAEASSSLSSTVVQGREDRSRDSQNKRPKVHSLSL